MKSICVYLGAKTGKNELFFQAVHILGKQIANRGYHLIYGGSSEGLMGILANTVLNNGGTVTGIIPNHLIRQEKPLDTLSELIITETMQERKLRMQQQADGFIVMPGGLGTLEEVFELWNAIKMGLINKPIAFLNVDGFFNDLFSFITHCEMNNMLTSEQMQIPKINSDPTLLLDELFLISEEKKDSSLV